MHISSATLRSRPEKSDHAGNVGRMMNLDVLEQMYRNKEMCDVELVGRGASEGVMAHGLFLALASPVMRSMVRWEANKAATNSEGTMRAAGKSHLVISLPETDTFLLKMLVDCIYGGRLSQSCSINDIIGLGRLGDMYDIASLRAVVEDAAIRVLDGCNCGPLLSMSTECNMLKLEERCKQHALRDFGSFCRGSGFKSLKDQDIISLLEDDRLSCEIEDFIYEAILQRVAERGMEGIELMSYVRFHFMSEPSVGRVLDDARAMGIPKLAEFVDRDIQQARKQGRALRGGYGPSADQWQSLHTHGDPLKGHAGSVEALVWYSPTDGGDACLISGSRDGQIRLWSAGSRVGEILQTGQADSIGAVHSLALHGDVLISGGQKKANGAAMHVWCLVSRRRVRHVDDGHVDAVMCMSTGRGRLYSGSWDMTVREWSMPDVSCSRVIRVGSPILSLLVCGSSLAFNIKTGVAMSCNLEDDTSEPSTCGCDESKGITTMVVTSGPRQHKIGGMASTSTCFVAGGRLVTGHGNGTIRVWDAQTYTPQATAFAHSEAVTCMAVCGTSLISASNDGLVKIWDLGAVDLSCDSCELKWIKVIRLPCEVVSLVTASPNSVFCSTKDRSIRRLSWSNLVRDVAG